MELFNIDKEIAVYILVKRLWRLFQLSTKILVKYTVKDLHHINNILEVVPSNVLEPILPLCNLDKINKHNIHDIIRYLNDYHDLTTREVEWGPGNHGDINNNIHQHYIKHVLSDEGYYWKLLLPAIDLVSYMRYAQMAFKRMERIVIHSNGKQTYMSGFFGKVFVVGRYNHGVFGISSCYYVSDGEKPGRYVDECLNIYQSPSHTTK
jgi:hypothetical protein